MILLQVDKKRQRKIGNPMGFLIVFPVVVVVESLSLLTGTSSSSSTSRYYALRGQDIPTLTNGATSSFSLFFGPSNHQDLPPPDQQQQLLESNIMFSTASLDSASSSSSSSSSVVPTWLPYHFTRSQLECLRVVELRVACAERGLKKSGTKAILQNRLMEWVTEQHQLQFDEINKKKQQQQTILDPALDYHRKMKQQRRNNNTNNNKNKNNNITESLQQDCFEDEEDYYDKTINLQPTGLYLQALSRNFYTQTAKFSNLQVQQIYQNAKHADQNGNKQMARQLLYQLHEATPGDGRVLRRLSRLAMEFNEPNEARRLLQLGTRLTPNNGYLWHGLAQLELQLTGNIQKARDYYQRAIQVDPTSSPNPYHAWARLEQSQGNIRVAAALLKQGLHYHKTNNNSRLWHALSRLYRDAGMYSEATHALTKAMQTNKVWSKAFGYTEQAYVAYEMGNLDLARHYMQQGIQLNPRHSQGWLSLAQLEESCRPENSNNNNNNNIARARLVYQTAADTYEKSRNIYHKSSNNNNNKSWNNRTSSPRIPTKPGDKWLALYLNWAKMEESYSNNSPKNYYSLADKVYSRAANVFPTEWRVFLNWAMYQAKRRQLEKAKITFKKACLKSGRKNIEPYRIYGEYAMEMGDYDVARMIFFSGAKTVSSNHRDGYIKGFAATLHSWSICELKLHNLDRASELLERALSLSDDLEEKAQFLSTKATVECMRHNYRLAKHCVTLAIYSASHNNASPRFVSSLWNQWATIAEKMNDDGLAQYCREQAKLVKEKSELLTSPTPVVTANRIIKESLGKAPWYNKILRDRSRK